MKLVIFDCDGTLVDSQHLIVEAMNMSFHANGIAPLPRQQILSIVGLSLPLAIETLMPDEPPQMIEALTGGYRDAFTVLRQSPASHEPLYDGIREVVEALAVKDDVVLGIATGKSIRGSTGFSRIWAGLRISPPSRQPTPTPQSPIHP